MNENKAKQHARDIQTVAKAVVDAKEGNYDQPHSSLADKILSGGGNFRSDSDIHDRKVYNAAYKEAKKH